MATTAIRIPTALNAKLTDQARRIGVSKAYWVNVIGCCACEALKAMIPAVEVALACEQDKPIKDTGQSEQATVSQDVDAVVGEHLAKYARALRMSRSQLFACVLEEWYAKFYDVRAPTRHDTNMVVRSKMAHMIQRPRTSEPKETPGEPEPS